MPEYLLDPHVVHAFDALPVYVEGSRVDQALVQDSGPAFGATRYDVFRSSRLTYEAEVDLSGLSQTCVVLLDTVFLAHHYSQGSGGEVQHMTVEFFLDDESIGAGLPPHDWVPTSGQVPFPPYVTEWDGTQQDNTYRVHDALAPEVPDASCATVDFFPFPDKYFIRDGLVHFHAPCYYYFRPPFPQTFRITVTGFLDMPNERRGTLPTDIAPLEQTSPDHWRYPVGGGYGPASSEADTTYAHVERFDWEDHRLEVLQFFCGEVAIAPGPSGVVWHPQGGGAVRSIPTIGRQGPAPEPIVP